MAGFLTYISFSCNPKTLCGTRESTLMSAKLIECQILNYHHKSTTRKPIKGYWLKENKSKFSDQSLFSFRLRNFLEKSNKSLKSSFVNCFCIISRNYLLLLLLLLSLLLSLLLLSFLFCKRIRFPK